MDSLAVHHTMVGVELRRCRIDDRDELMRLWHRAGLDHVPEGRDSLDGIRRAIENDSSLLLVAEVDGEMVGSIMVSHDGRKGWINRLAVKPDHQREGLATLLVDEGEAFLQSLGIDVFCCLIFNDNVASQHLFHRLGYESNPHIWYYRKKLRPEA